MNTVDDFAALVSRSNPAARGHYDPFQQPNQPSSAAYPPRAQNYDLDPFFDDDDVEGATPGTTGFGPAPYGPSHGGHYTGRDNTLIMDSVPDLPLTSNAAPLAGAPGASSNSLPQGWAFDDENVALPPPNGGAPAKEPPPQPKKRKWKWPWSKPEQLEGERIIWLNDSAKNDEAAYCSNYVSTSKYNVVTFLPKFFAGQCSSELLAVETTNGLPVQNNFQNMPMSSSSSLVRNAHYG